MILLFAETTLDFDRPWWLVLLLLIVPAFWIAYRSTGGLSTTKTYVTFAARTIVIVLLATALAEPLLNKRGEGVTAVVLLDRSNSIPGQLKARSVEFLRRAAEAKDRDEDRIAVITIGRTANITAMPDRNSAVTTGQEVDDRTATNLAAGVRMAMAIMPDDTASRIILASDGNETMDSVLEAAEIAMANRIPIDVVRLEYEHRNEIIFESIEAPARTRVGQPINVKMLIRSQSPSVGTVYLEQNGRPLDLNGSEPGDGYHVELTSGVNPLIRPVVMVDNGPQRFTARFEPDDLAADAIVENNRAEAVTFVSGEGRVLVLDDGTVDSEYLVRALHEAAIETDVRSPGQLIGGPVTLSGYDAIVLTNVPRWSFDDEQDRMLHAYVHDMGGGLIMTGGSQSFGAGGWIDSEVARLLPVKLDPPQTKQMLRGALALIMHSCEMPQGNFWGEKVAVAAIETLSSQDYVGILEFDWQNGAAWAHPMSIAGDKQAPIAAAKKLVNGDMPDFGTAMKVALTGMANLNAGQKHCIIISDGDPSPPSQALLNDFVAAGVSVTTVMVGGHGTAGDQARMQAIANITGGNFHPVTNPMNLPKIFIKEAQLVSRSLIVEGQVYPQEMVSSLPGPLEGFRGLPPVEGYILVDAREGLAEVPVVTSNTEGADPIFAYWNYGLGKAIAYTPDVTAKWGVHMVVWDQYRAFWERTVRWVMRPSTSVNMMVNTRVDGDVATVELEALDADASFLNFLRTQTVVIDPSGQPQRVSLQQVGPGKYRTSFRLDASGSYLVNVNYSGGTEDAPIRGNIQSAVAVPYEREYRDIRHNGALLRTLAERTGGRDLSLGGDPLLVNLFDRTDLEVPKTPKRIWDLLLILAASLFIVDVAARRLAVDPKWVAGLFRRLFGERGRAGENTVEAWKKARAQVAHRRDEAGATIEAPPEADARFEADATDAATSLDVGAEIARGGPAAPKATRRDATTSTEGAGGPGEEEDTMSRLKAARRRAKQDGDASPDDGKGTDG